MASKTIEHTTVAYLDNEDRADISNPIHSTEVAKAYGFGGPLVGGVTVWGWATDTILEALGDDWLWDGWAEYSFRQPTFPGDTLVIKADADGGQGSKSWTIRMVNQSGELCVLGKVGLGRADWSHEFVRPRTMTPVIELPVKTELTLGNARPGTDWAAAQMDLTGDVMKEFVSQKQRTANPLFTGDRAIAHPSWTAGWAEKLLRHNFDIPSSMHTRSRVQHYNKVSVDTSVVGCAHLIDVYERKAHHFANFDVLLQDNHGDDIAQLRHWTIFKIATVEERANMAS